MLLTNPTPVQRKRGRLVRPVRVTPPSTEPFGSGLEEHGLCCPIDQRPLPTVDGVGLTKEEAWRVTGAENRARAAYAHDCPEATLLEIDHVARKAAMDELRRLLMERPAAPPLKPAKGVKGIPPSYTPAETQAPVPMGTTQAERPRGRNCQHDNTSRPMPFTAADLAWWIQNSPTRNRDYEVVSRRPGVMDWSRWHQEAAPESPEEHERVGVLAGHVDLD